MKPYQAKTNQQQLKHHRLNRKQYFRQRTKHKQPEIDNKTTDQTYSVLHKTQNQRPSSTNKSLKRTDIEDPRGKKVPSQTSVEAMSKRENVSTQKELLLSFKLHVGDEIQSALYV